MDQVSTPSTSTETSRPRLRGFLYNIALNAVIPLLLYRLAKRYVSASEVVALSRIVTSDRRA